VLGDVSAIFERAKSRAAPRVRRLTVVSIIHFFTDAAGGNPINVPV